MDDDNAPPDESTLLDGEQPDQERLEALTGIKAVLDAFLAAAANQPRLPVPDKLAALLPGVRHQRDQSCQTDEPPGMASVGIQADRPTVMISRWAQTEEKVVSVEMATQTGPDVPIKEEKDADEQPAQQQPKPRRNGRVAPAASILCEALRMLGKIDTVQSLLDCP